MKVKKVEIVLTLYFKDDTDFSVAREVSDAFADSISTLVQGEMDVTETGVDSFTIFLTEE